MRRDRSRRTLLLAAALATAVLAPAGVAAAGPPAVATLAPAGVTFQGATLHGRVNPRGLDTAYFFQYGLTPAYGFRTASAAAGAGRAAIDVGAAIVNDFSGLRDPALAEVCAQTGAGLIIAHTRAAPKQKLLDPALDGRVLEDVTAFLAERIALATRLGMRFEQLALDPGPDLSKTPAQTIEVLRQLRALHSLRRPLLLAVSRKDFIGALTGRPPRARLAGTLAAIAYGVDAGAHLLRVHDVAEAADYLAVRQALRGEAAVEPGLRLAKDLRWEQADEAASAKRASAGSPAVIPR
jgi:hypothetical protein